MNPHDDVPVGDLAPTSDGSKSETTNPPAWEMIEPGRFQPRRIRGSHRGRELG